MPHLLSKKTSERVIFLAVIAVAVFFRLFRTDYSFLLNSWILNTVTIAGGLLGVIFIYFLARELFSWQIASLAGFFAGISAWYVAISRETLWASWTLNFFILALYFLWKGLKGNHICNFVFSGLFLGLTLYLSYPFYAPLLIVLLAVLAYLHLLKKDFSHDQYVHSCNFLVRGFSWLLVLSLVLFIVLRWLNIYSYSFGQMQENVPSYSLTLAMIVLLATGLFRSFVKFIRSLKRHGHFSAAQTIILSWFFLGLLSQEGIFALPVILILSAEGCWWFFNWLRDWYGARDKHLHEADFVTTLVLIIFLFALSLVEYQSYFHPH